MSKLSKYLLSEKSYKEVASNIATAEILINRNCKHYLKLLRGREPLRRGMKNIGLPQGELFKRSVRQDRIPHIPSLDQFKIINEWLSRNGHVRRDKAVIATSDPQSTLFGTQYYIFPIGKFNYTWIKSKDWNWISSTSSWRGTDIIYPLEEIEWKLDQQEESGNIISNKKFSKAYNMEYEIWMDCKEYYFMEPQESRLW